MNLEETKMMQEREYQKKIKEIEKRNKEALEAKLSGKFKNEAKSEQAKHKNVMLQKDQEE